MAKQCLKFWENREGKKLKTKTFIIAPKVTC